MNYKESGNMNPGTRVKIIGSKYQLDEIGISNDLNNKIGTIMLNYQDGYYEVRVNINNIMNEYDIPRFMLCEVVE